VHYRTLGRTGVQVSSLVLGAMNFGTAIRAGRDITTSRSTFMPQRFDTAIPANRARLDAVEQLAKTADEAGLTMIQLALGFVTAHPAVTSAIIGPRTLDNLPSQLAAADTVLSADVLDAIEAIVAPGVDLAAHEKNDTPPALLDPARRRRFSLETPTTGQQAAASVRTPAA
jgi:aryl-alcohol dehydrogenase-like predicted oxidoreductase